MMMMPITMTMMRIRIIVLENIKEKDQCLVALTRMRYMEAKVIWKIATKKMVPAKMAKHQGRIKGFQRKGIRRMAIMVLLLGSKKEEMVTTIIHMLISWIGE